MTEQEIMEKIKVSADQIEIPEELRPERMKEKLVQTDRKSGKVRDIFIRHGSMRVAAALLVCGLGAFAVYGGLNGMRDSVDQNIQIAEDKEESEYNAAKQTAGVTGSSSDHTETDAESELAKKEPKQDAGELYVVAKDYGQVYDVLEDYYGTDYIYNGSRFSTDDAISEASDLSSTYGPMAEPSSSAPEQVNANAIIKESAKNSEEKFSDTNVQTEGVDESDIIKTDGSYIYVVAGSSVDIVGVHTDKMEKVGSVSAAMDNASDRIVEMYVEGDCLNLIVQKTQTRLKEGYKPLETDVEIKKSASGVIALDERDSYYIDTNMVTELQTYDISDRARPVLKGTVTQDGYYNTSRKIGNVIYLFTGNSIKLPQLTRSDAVISENAGGWIPLVNGSAIAADCIYLPQQGSQGLVVSSVDVDHPDQIVDNTLIVNDYVNIYVSTKALYLYSSNYDDTTQIAKFALDGGTIQAVGAVSVPGQIRDTFAINEYQGKLRVLTTNWGSSIENGLYLYDEKLDLTGKLGGIAPGEQIYAARYFGNTAYFITYRNTDPLFAVDLTDETNPTVLSELEITGFSEYLHFWGKDKLVGIGYETDPDNGAQEGIKLVMFDISNPAKLATAGTCVIENIEYSPALYDYKCVLVDESENLIGFAAESFGRQGKTSYLLFEWENGSFQNLMTDTLNGSEDISQYRGIYIGDRFYLAGTKSITSYDRKNNYQRIQNLDL